MLLPLSVPRRKRLREQVTDRPHTPDVFEVEKMLPLTDGAVVVDELRPDDGDAYLANAPLATDFFWPVAMDPGAIEDWIRGSAPACAPSLLLAIRANGILVAGVEARALSRAIGELLYWVFPAHRGCGYATRAVALVRDALRVACDVTTIQMRVRSGNAPSLAVAKRLGFVEVERHGDEILFYG